jgi:hypothetical protein
MRQPTALTYYSTLLKSTQGSESKRAELEHAKTFVDKG